MGAAYTLHMRSESLLGSFALREGTRQGTDPGKMPQLKGRAISSPVCCPLPGSVLRKNRGEAINKNLECVSKGLYSRE